MAHLNRRRLLAGLGASIALPWSMPAIAASSDIAERLAGLAQAGRVPGLHALLVSQGGKLVIEHYGQGEDEALGRPLGHVTFAPEVLHDDVSGTVASEVWSLGATVYSLIAGRSPFGDRGEG